jgi:DNA-binding MurR/RpiR family transcriptional regulator
MERDLSTFSKGHRAIASYILENYDKAAYMTAASIGKQVGVSESTVVRFATELGFKGYPALQRALGEIVRINLNSIQRVQLTNSMIGEGDIISKVFASDAEKLRETLEELDRGAFERSVDKLLSAKNIYIIGARSSAFLAGFLDYNLSMIFNNVRLVQTGSGVEIFEKLYRVGEGDVVFAISFPRYSSRVVNAVKFARDKGADVIAMTDGVGSPIAKNATECLVAKSDMVSFVDSITAPLSIINAILVAIVRKKETEFSEKLLQLEEIWEEYDVYDKNR